MTSVPELAAPTEIASVDQMFLEARRHFDAGNLGQAAKLCHAIINIQKNHVPSFQMLGSLAYRRGNFGLSVEFFRCAAALMPDDSRNHNNLATALSASGRNNQAINCIKKVMLRDPGFFSAYYNMGNILQRLGNFEEAMTCYQRTLTIEPKNVDAHWNLALTYLRAGRFADGWAEYEWRWMRPGTPVEHRNVPGWDGRPFEGRTLLLVCEQGLGDTLQFVRYLPHAIQKGGSVILRCQPELVRLLSGFSGVAHIVTRDDPLPVFDVQSSLMSLPGLFGTTLETIPNQVPYLPVPGVSASRMLEGDGLKVGLVWGSSPTDPSRSCPLSKLLDLGRVPGVRFFSLQKGPWAADLGQVPEAEFIEDLSDRIHDMADTAAFVCQLDLIITVDTSVAHLAGALGRPTWILLPHLADWRWMVDREDCPWYPTARLFRQEAPGDWDGVIARLLSAFNNLTSSGASPGETHA